ncbi:hypothetical protein BKA83DRAFT_4343375 [Pisolithus microcarpus]|nr:hypothetical protein BKA83DRAFT_4343375 [Pisolithus microcarpus]
MFAAALSAVVHVARIVCWHALLLFLSKRQRERSLAEAEDLLHTSQFRGKSFDVLRADTTAADAGHGRDLAEALELLVHSALIHQPALPSGVSLTVSYGVPQLHINVLLVPCHYMVLR